LGRESVDLDLVLPGDIDAVRGPARRLAGRLDARAHILGRDEKRVWRIETGRLKVELWPLGELGLTQDIRRRDFTCNALMWQMPEGPLVDRVGGIDDLETGTLRAVKKKNLENDPVRLVRAARFLAQFPDFDIDQRTAVWIRSLASRVGRAPSERLGQELMRLLTVSDLERGFRALLDLGLLQRIVRPATRFDGGWLTANLGAASRMRPSTHPNRAALHAAGDAAPLAMLLRAWGSPHPDAIAGYAWPRTLRLRAARAATFLNETLTTVDTSAADRRIVIHRAGEAFPAALAFAAAVEPEHPWERWWRQWRERGPELVNPEPLLTGVEVSAALGISPGPVLGRAIDALTKAQVRGEVRTAGGARRWLRKNSETFER
jgi:tRNA nucleotidyltransferase/poly(A) polymerase